MNQKQEQIMAELIARYPILNSVKAEIEACYQVLEECYRNDGKLLIAGNGGSCADAEHIVGELMKGFCKRRELSEEMRERLCEFDAEHGKMLADGLQGGLMAIALTGHNALSTAFANDVNADMIYAQQVWGYGRIGDVFLGITTSGNAQNVDYAVTAAKAKGMKVLGLTGKDGGRLKQRADIAVVVPEMETFKIQELHLPIYHAICLMLEEYFF